MTQPTYTRAVLITGNDSNGNEYAYWRSSDSNTPEIPSMGKWDEWFDGYGEHYISARYVANYVYPNVVKVRFGQLELTRWEWINAASPVELSSIEIAAWGELKAAQRQPQIVNGVSSLEWFAEQKEVNLNG